MANPVFVECDADRSDPGHAWFRDDHGRSSGRQRSIEMADQIWEEKDYTDEDMNNLLNAEDQ